MNTDYDQIKKYGEMTAPLNACIIPDHKEFYDPIQRIRMEVRSGNPGDAIDILCDVIEELQKQIIALEQK